MALNFLNNGYFAGGVGIGTTNPLAKLDVSDTTTGIAAIVGNTTHNSRLQIYTNAVGKNSEIWFGDSADADVGKVDYDHNDNSMVFTTNASEKMVIDSDGNVGIGTDNPTGLLHVKGDTNSNGGELYLQINDDNIIDNIGTISFGNNTGVALSRIQAQTSVANNNSNLAFFTSAAATRTQKMVIDSGGSVGIGVVSPTERLQVFEGGLTAYKSYTNTNAGAILTSYQSEFSPFTKTTDLVAGSDSTVPSEIRFLTRTNGTSTIDERIRIQSDGNVGIGTDSPSRKFVVSNAGASGIEIQPNYVTGVNEILSFDRTVGATAYETMRFNGGDFQFQTSGSEKMVISSAGAIKFNAYSSTNQTGTPTYILGTNATGNVVKVLGSDIPGLDDGPYLPLTAGSTKPLTGDLFLGAFNKISGVTNDNLVIGVDINNLSGGSSFDIQIDGATSAFHINNTGKVKLGQYSGTSQTGTPTYILGTDASGNVLKVLGGNIPGGGGTVTGTGVAGQVAYWTTPTNVANNAGMSFANDQMQLDGISGGDGFDLPYDQDPGYSNMSAGGFGILFREARDNYILGNAYFYRTGNANTFRAKYGAHGATQIASDTGGFDFLTAPANTTAPHTLTFSSRMIIKQGGSVGIGTVNPGTINSVAFSGVGLHVVSGTLGRTITEGSSEASYLLNHSGASADQRIKYIQSKAGSLAIGSFDDNGLARPQVNILNGGNVGIGTDDPDSLLHLSSSNESPQGITVTGGDETFLKFLNSSTKNWGLITTNLEASDFGIYQSNLAGGDPFSAGTAQLYFDGSGNATFAGSVTIPNYIYHTGDLNTFFGFDGNDQIAIKTSGNYNFFADATATTLYAAGGQKLKTTIVSVGTATTAGGTLIDGWKTTTQANAIDDTTIATTAYVNNKIGLIPAEAFTEWVVRDSDDDDKTLSGGTNKYLKFAAATGALGTNLSGSGTTADPYIMTITSPDSDSGGTINSIDATTDGDSLGASNTLTGNGTLSLQWQGNTASYVRGDGSLATFPSIPTNNNEITNGAEYITLGDIPPGITGSGSNKQITYWTSSSNIDGDDSFKYELDSSGNALLDLSSASTQQIRFYETSSTYTDSMSLKRKADKLAMMYGDGDEGLTLEGGTGLTAGNVGIGINAPTEKLHVDGNILTSGDVILGDDSSIVLKDQPTASTASGSGTIVNWSVSETVAAGSLYVVKTNGGWQTTDADTEARSIGMLAIALGSNATDGMLLQGFFYKASHGFTIGLPLYISNTAGDFSTTRPIGINDYVRIIGYATSTNYIYFDPDKTFIKLSN